MNRLNLELEDRIEEMMNISPDVEKRVKKKEKLTAKDRIHKLLDRGSPYLSISQLAGSDDDVPMGNLYAGIGLVHGKHCMIIANNFTYKGGAYYPITVKK